MRIPIVDNLAFPDFRVALKSIYTLYIVEI